MNTWGPSPWGSSAGLGGQRSWRVLPPTERWRPPPLSPSCSTATSCRVARAPREASSHSPVPGPGDARPWPRTVRDESLFASGLVLGLAQTGGWELWVTSEQIYAPGLARWQEGTFLLLTDGFLCKYGRAGARGREGGCGFRSRQVFLLAPGWASRGRAPGPERFAVSPVGPHRGGPRGLQGPRLTWILGPPWPPLISSVARLRHLSVWGSSERRG